MVEGNEAVRAGTGNPGERAQPGDQPAERCAHAGAGDFGGTAYRRHGPDGDRHPGDFAGAAADLLRCRPGVGLATARTLNDEIADIVGRHPDRFTGLGTIPLQAPELAIAELERLHNSLGMRGIEIMTHVAGEDLSAERFRKVFRRIEELGLLVFMHPDGFTEARRFKEHYFANVIGNPLDTTVALHHLIFGGVLEDCPGLKLVAAHGGGYLPAYAGRIDHAASARRIPARS